MAIGKLLRNKIQVWPHEIWEGGNSQKWDDKSLLKSRIYTIRGVNFRFQLTLKEAETCSRSKISSLNNSRRGTNIKYAPYAFTEQGIYMLMTVLKGERATAQSKALIRLFKQMKDCIVENQQLIGVDLFCSKYSPADKDEV